MSLSSQKKHARAPKVIVGIGARGPGELSLSGFGSSQESSRWDEATEAEYIGRVKDRAASMAVEIVTKARAEAEELKRQALEEGFAEGLRQAQEQLETARGEMAAALANSLAAVRQGQVGVWAEHRKGLVELVRLCMEKALGLEVDERRKEILAGFLDQAVDALDARTGLVLRVHPEDEPSLREILQSAEAAGTNIGPWRIQADPGMQPGGLVLESDQGMVDNSLESRRAVIHEILDQLSLPGRADTKTNPKKPSA